MKSSRGDRLPVIRKLAHGASESRDTSLFGRLLLLEQKIRASRGYSETSTKEPNVARILNRRVPPIATLTRYIE
jgi:hypothetical protein